MSGKSEVIDNLKVVCKCNGIKKVTFKKLILRDVVTLAELKKATGAGSGDCGGKQCLPRLYDMLETGVKADS